MAVAWQLSLLGDGPPRGDPAFAGAERRDLGSGAWVEHVPGWLAGADELFEAVLTAAPWQARERPMYDRMVAEPRLTTGEWRDPPAPIPELGRMLSERYEHQLTVVSANLYRDGRDSVAWHGDRIGRRTDETVVALVSLGSPRRFLLRPKGGGSSLRYVTRPGDLLVLGGTCQRTWEHSVPKVKAAGPRISVMFREGY
ncbi:MAG TPA: alpha-ketoglutarate-dependent dioxygenase AlkB [Acidimicrobiales bacterium]